MILNRKGAKLIPAYMVLAGSCLAGEYAVLASGFRVHADRHESDGSTVRLFSNGGFTEFPSSQISSFENDGQVPPLTAAKAAPPSPQDPEELVNAAATHHGLPPELVRSVVAAESGFQTNAVSPKGAIGLMQLMPATARDYGADPRDPRQNVEAGAQYLRDLLVKYQNDDHQVSRALAAYNAGPGAVDRYHGVPPYRETRAYVARVIRKYEKQSAAPKALKPSAGKTPDPPSRPE